ncbi:MAG: hypothetical protein KDL31_06205 [Kiritimatiellae bacterium]|nr:hypothetical protein [Kiritimatiellia bacterium]
MIKKLIGSIVVLGIAGGAYIYFSGKDVDELIKDAGGLVDATRASITNSMNRTKATEHSEDEVMNIAEPTMADIAGHFWEDRSGHIFIIADHNMYWIYDFYQNEEISAEYAIKPVVSLSDNTESVDGRAVVYGGQDMELVIIENDELDVAFKTDPFGGRTHDAYTRVKGEKAQKCQQILDVYLAAK